MAHLGHNLTLGVALLRLHLDVELRIFIFELRLVRLLWLLQRRKVTLLMTYWNPTYTQQEQSYVRNSNIHPASNSSMNCYLNPLSYNTQGQSTRSKSCSGTSLASLSAFRSSSDGFWLLLPRRSI